MIANKKTYKTIVHVWIDRKMSATPRETELSLSDEHHAHTQLHIQLTGDKAELLHVPLLLGTSSSKSWHPLAMAT
jgi:hypothetical protein